MQDQKDCDNGQHDGAIEHVEIRFMREHLAVGTLLKLDYASDIANDEKNTDGIETIDIALPWELTTQLVLKWRRYQTPLEARGPNRKEAKGSDLKAQACQDDDLPVTCLIGIVAAGYDGSAKLCPEADGVDDDEQLRQYTRTYC